MATLRLKLYLLPVLYGLACSAAVAERSATTNYVLRCIGCHGQDGTGAPSQGIPAFPGWLDPLYSHDQGRTYLSQVPGVASSSLSARETAAVLNYIAQRWARAPATLPLFTAEEIQARQRQKVPDIVALRRYLAQDLQAQGIALAPYPWP